MEKATFTDYPCYGGAVFTAIPADDEHILFTKTENGETQEKIIRIEKDNEDYIYRIRKTKVKAKRGVSGLMDFLREAESYKDFASTFQSSFYHKMFEFCK